MPLTCRRRAVASKKDTGTYPAHRAALGGRTLKTGQRRWLAPHPPPPRRGNDTINWLALGAFGALTGGGGRRQVNRPAIGVSNPIVSLVPQPPCKSLLRTRGFTAAGSSRSGDCSTCLFDVAGRPPATTTVSRKAQYESPPQRQKENPVRFQNPAQPARAASARRRH